MNWARIRLWLGVKPKRRGLNVVVAKREVDRLTEHNTFVTDSRLGVRIGGQWVNPDLLAAPGSAVRQDAQKMELLRARMTRAGLLTVANFNEIAEEVIKKSRHRDWSWETVLKVIEDRCNDKLWGPVITRPPLPDPATVPYGTVIEGFRAMGDPVRWVRHWAESDD